MKIMMKMTAVAVLGILLFTGCGPDRTEKKLGPAESITHLTKSIADGDGFQAWAFLPKSWRADINGLAHLIGEKMPADIWDKSFALIGRVGALLETKADLLFEMTGGQLPPKMSKADVLASLKDLGKVLTTLAKSKVSTVKSLETVDLADVAEDSASTIFKLISANKLINQLISQNTKGKVTSVKDGLLKFKTKLISEKGDTAKISMTPPIGRAEEGEMTKVEGKWLPLEMVEEYKRNMPKMKKELGKELDGMAKKALFFAGGVAMVDSIISSLEKAKTGNDMKKILADVPGFNFNPMKLLAALGTSSAKAKQLRAKMDLTHIGISVAIYFADGSENTFPGSFSGYDIPAEINLSKYVYLAKKGGAYSGDAAIGLACEKPDPSKKTLYIVYEDGHVGELRGSFSSIADVRAALKKK